MIAVGTRKQAPQRSLGKRPIDLPAKLRVRTETLQHRYTGTVAVDERRRCDQIKGLEQPTLQLLPLQQPLQGIAAEGAVFGHQQSEAVSHATHPSNVRQAYAVSTKRAAGRTAS